MSGTVENGQEVVERAGARELVKLTRCVCQVCLLSAIRERATGY